VEEVDILLVVSHRTWFKLLSTCLFMLDCKKKLIAVVVPA